MELLECIHLCKKFDDKLILDDVNFKVPRGKIVGLLGKNGTGKSTIIKLINDLAVNGEYDIVALFVTDILRNGSYIFYNDNSCDILDECFGHDLVQGKYLEGIVSRKKQVIPTIMERLEK